MEPNEVPGNEVIKPELSVGSLRCGNIQLDYELKYLTFRDYCCRKRLTNFINLLKEKNEEYSFHLEILNHEKKRLRYLQMEVEELTNQSQREACRLYRMKKEYLQNSISSAFLATTSYVTSAASTAKSWFNAVINFMDFPK